MVQWQGRSKRKSTGGKYRYARGKRKHELGRPPAETLVGEQRRKRIRTRGGNSKIRLLRINKVNVNDPETGRSFITDILDVQENPANKDFSRRKIITKGAMIQTSAGTVVVTSRPGQHGIVNAKKI
ncbi:MAG: 30S ribosomal protein S8e [Promethearchaeota archaeon]